MTDIKELALKVAKDIGYWDEQEEYILDFATRLIAAYLAEQEPVAWDGAEEWEQLAWNLCAEEGGEESCTELLWDGGPIPEPWGDRWLKYEGEAKRMISLVRKFTAPPTEPAPRLPEGCMWAVTKGGHSICQPPKSFCQKGAAPSSEEVREMVERLRLMLKKGHVRLDEIQDVDGAADLIERLAARVPDGCVVVPRDPTEAMILSGNLMQHGVRAAYKSMIAAGEVK